MTPEEHIAAIRTEGARLADAAAAAGLDAEVPTCPGWRVRDLLTHAGGVHRWAASYLTDKRTEPWPTEDEAPFFDTGGDDANLVDWYRAGLGHLATTLAEADPDVACWYFLPAPTPLASWARRQAHEIAVHRVDAEAAAGRGPTPTTAEFAVDGLDELLLGFHGRGRGRLRADPPLTMTLRTDRDDAWTVHIGPERRTTERAAAADADLTITGGAFDLYLLLWNRATPDAVALTGDRRPLDIWREQARIVWT